MATANGLCVDPHKVQAIMRMLPLKDVTAVLHLFGLAQHLNKFLPHLFDITEALRELTRRTLCWFGVRCSKMC